MRLVVADTGPINYLILIEAIDLLPRLFETVFVPRAVYEELAHADAPAAVRAWAAQVPNWLEIRPDPDRNANDAAERLWTRASVPQSRSRSRSTLNSSSWTTVPRSRSRIGKA